MNVSQLPRNQRLPLLRTREHFDYWLFDMSDALEYFLASLPEPTRVALDFSPASLDVLEAWLLQRYPTPQDALGRYEMIRMDDAGRYIGETFRKAIGCQWDVRLRDPHEAYYELPILRRVNPPYEECPFSLATASIDRRTGYYIRTVLEKQIARLAPESRRPQS